MKQLVQYTIVLALLVALTGLRPAWGQQDWAFLQANNVGVQVNAIDPQWFDGQNTGVFYVPVGAGIASLFSGSIWIGGQDVSGQLCLAAERFGTNGDDFWSGPVADDGQYDPFGTQWNRVWTLTRDQIEDHIQFWDQSFYTPPADILTWPAHGDPAKGEAYNLAPFIDLDGDNIYEPMDGDYPNIRGDEAVYSIFNDAYDNHTNSGGQRMKAEVHLMTYAYACNLDEALNNTVFMDYRIINRSSNTYTDTYLGFWSEGDLGDPTDDFVGCDVLEGAYYYYNGDNIDGDPGSGSNPGYGQNPPAQGVVFLAGPQQDADGIDNMAGVGTNESPNGVGYGDGIADNERLGLTGFMYHNNGQTQRGDPQTATDYYNYLRGLWRDNIPLTYGGTGYNPNDPNAISARFMHPGSTDLPGYGTGGNAQPTWSEITSANNPGDRRGVGASGPFTFEPNEEVHLELALVHSRDLQGGNTEPSVAKLRNDIAHIRTVYFTNQSACGGPINSTPEHEAEFGMLLVPNPASGVTTLSIDGIDPNGTVTIHDLTGKLVLTQAVNRSQEHLDIRSLEAGAYLVNWRGSHQSITQKLIIQ